MEQYLTVTMAVKVGLLMSVAATVYSVVIALVEAALNAIFGRIVAHQIAKSFEQDQRTFFTASSGRKDH